MSVRPSWIAFGWFIAAAMTAFLLLALGALGVVTDDTLSDAGGVWTAIALFFGFLVGGFFAGARVGTAPVLHGIGIGLVSVLVWLLGNLLAGAVADFSAWAALPLATALLLISLQTVAAVLGARIGAGWNARSQLR